MTHRTTTAALEESRPPRQRCFGGGCDTTGPSSGSPRGALLLHPAFFAPVMPPVMFVAFLGRRPIQEPEFLGKIAISCPYCRSVQEPELLTEKDCDFLTAVAEDGGLLVAGARRSWRREVEGF